MSTRLLQIAATGVLSLWSGAVRGQDCWAPEPLFPGAPVPASASFVVQATGDYDRGYVPQFRSGARDRGAFGADVALRIAPFEVRARWAWLWDTTAAGGTVAGAGDLHLGTVVTVARWRAFDFTLGWEAKLPNADDSNGLGTDETDVSFGGTAGWRHGELEARLGAGLAILGNPLRFANQDDVPLLQAALVWQRGPLGVIGRVDGQLATARNPARVQGDVAARWGTTWHVLAHGGGGFTPAAADWHGGIRVGYAGSLPGLPFGE